MGPAGKILPNTSINIWNPALKLLLLPKKKKIYTVFSVQVVHKGRAHAVKPGAATSATVPEM